MYESPIEMFSVTDYAHHINEQIESAVYEAITKVGINVNKEELIKALQYDRDQYEKGYADGLNERPEVVCCKDCKWWSNEYNSLQGRCELLQIYPTGAWFCGNAQRKEVDE